MRTAAEAVWPNTKAPTRAQVERMYKLAYTIEPSIFRPEDIINFGIDLRRLKEFGEVRMSKNPSRAHVDDLWGRMDQYQRAAFLMSYLGDSLRSVETLVKALEKELGELKDIRDALTWLHAGLFGRFPKSLHKRLQRGLARWGNNGGF